MSLTRIKINLKLYCGSTVRNFFAESKIKREKHKTLFRNGFKGLCGTQIKKKYINKNGRPHFVFYYTVAKMCRRLILAQSHKSVRNNSRPRKQ